MAQDVARLIWKMARDEKSLDEDLKHQYKKKIKLAETFWYRHVKNSIQKLFDSQSDDGLLPEDDWIVLDDVGIEVYVKAVRRTLGPNDDVKSWEANPYMRYCDENDDWLEVTDHLGKHLISKAFLPLDLKWDLDSVSDDMHRIIVSWDHWSTE